MNTSDSRRQTYDNTAYSRQDAAPASSGASSVPAESAHPRSSVPANRKPAQKSVRRPIRKRNDFIKPTDIVRIRGGVDRPMLIIIVLLICFGAVMVFSSSYAFAEAKRGDSFYYIKRHLIFVAFGLFAMSVAMHFDYRWLRKCTIPIFVGTCGLLVLVLLTGIARGKAQRWIQLGPITIQPSEIMKFALVLMLSLYIARNQDRITNYRNFWQSSVYGTFIPFTIVGSVCVLVALEKHFSGTIIIFAIGMVVIFAGGSLVRWFAAGIGAATAVIVPAMLFVPYARQRLDVFLHPENYSAQDETWQTLQGLYAVGSGGFFGVGLGQSRQKHLYVSEPQNDFIFSIICEELGFIGALAVIALFVAFVWRGFTIALKAPDTFSSLVVIGIVSQVAIQAILNIAVVTNTIPNTGISLPFFSYGGTAIVMLLGEMGIVLSISRYSYRKK